MAGGRGYSGRSGRSSGGYSGRSSGRGTVGPPPSDGGRSVGGFLGNLAGEVGGTITGLPGGLVETVRNPVKSAKAIGRSYAETYGPLLRGDIDEFAAGLYERPLGPVLDIATVVTGGGAAASKLGLASKTTRSIELRSPRALATGEGPTVSGRVLSRNPVIRTRQLGIDRLLKSLPASTPIVGELARYGRALDRLPRQEASRLQLASRKFARAFEKLSKEERAAWHLLSRAMSPDEYAEFLRANLGKGVKVEPSTLKVLASPGVRAAYDNPSPRLTRALEEGRALSELDKQIKVEHKVLLEETAGEREFLAARLVSGAEFLPQPEDLARFGLTAEEYIRNIAELRPGARVRAADRDNIGRIVAMNGDQATVNFINRAEGTEATINLPISELTPLAPREAMQNVETSVQGGKPIEELRAEGRDPFYVPDKDVAEKVSIGRSGGGFGVPRNPVQQNKGVLLKMGRLAMKADTLTPRFLKDVKFALYDDIHAGLLDGAVRVAKGERAPKGYEYIRRPVGARRRPERIPYTEKTRGEFRDVQEEFVEEFDADLLEPSDFTTSHASEALEQDGFYLTVPRAVAKQATGEFLRSSKATQLLLERPTSVWRALILGLRPAWLVNNIIGNHLMYAVRLAGPAGLHAYVNMVKETRGVAAARRMVTDREVLDRLTQEDVERWFPEQVEGTFVGTQLPAGRVGGAMKKASLGLVPANRAIEGGLRRAAVEAYARKHPAVRERMREMPKETRSFRKAAREVVDAEPQVRQEISQLVDETLGKFNNLSPFERGVLRRAAPFYAWYRAITLVVGRMPLDTPGRTDLLTKVGQIGEDEGLENVPTYLRAAIPVGEPEAGGVQRVIGAGPMNPYQTVVDIGRAGRALLPGAGRVETQALAGMFNPFLVASGGLLGEADRGRFESPRGLPGDLIGGVGRDLPLFQLNRGPSALYPRRSLESQLLAYFGLPVKDVNLAEAARRRAQERGGG